MLKAGTARLCISPGADPKEVTSYRNPPPAGFYHDIFTKALALEDEKGNRLVIVSIDIISFDGDLQGKVAQIRQMVKEKIGLDESRMLLCVSHTHSGPVREKPFTLKQFGLTVEEYKQILIDRIVAVIEAAFTDMEPVNLYFGRGDLHISINRRWKNPDGRPVWRGNPYGEIDPEVGILRADDKDGNVKAVVMNYACHASAMGSSLIGNDYPGFAQEIIESRYAGCTALFAQGCAGEIKTCNVDNNFKFMYGVPPAVVAGLGWEMAKEVSRVIETVPMEELDGEIQTTRRIVELPMEGPPSEEQVKSIKSAKDVQSGSDIAECWGDHMLKKIKEGKIDEVPTAQSYEVGLVSIGRRFRLVILQGEPCVRIGLRIKEQLTPNAAKVSKEARNVHSVMVFGYTNDWAGYIPSREVQSSGGYETESYLFHNWAGPYKPGIEDIVVKTVLEL